MGFFGVLTLLLVAAKLFGFAHYGWLVAFAPVAVSLFFATAAVILAAILNGR